MLLIFVAWLLLLALCVASGATVLGLLVLLAGRPYARPVDLWRLAWLGFALVIAELQLLSLILPMGGWALTVIVLVAAMGLPTLPALARAWRRASRTTPRSALVVYAVLLAAASLLLACTASGDVSWYDTISTHLQQVKWARSYRAVPGLANLSTKLGFEQAFHLMCALIDRGPLAARAIHAALGFLVFLTLGRWLWILNRPAPTPSARHARLFAAFTAPFLANKALDPEVASYSGDLAMACVALVVGLELIALPALDTRITPRGRRDLPLSLFVLMGMATLLVCVKLSGLALAGAASLAIFIAWRQGHAPRIWAGLPLPVALVIGSLTRRAILTGWLFYPIPFGNLHLSWSLPLDRVVTEYNWIRSWARMPQRPWQEVLGTGFFHWFVPWFDGFRNTRACVLFFTGCTLVGARLCLGAKVSTVERCALLAGASSLIYWFVGAPDLRFGAVFFWIFFAVALTGFLSAYAQAQSFPSLTPLVVLSALALTAWNGGFDLRLPRAPRWTTLDIAPLVPTVSVTPRAPDDVPGLLTPRAGDQCGDGPLPCSTQPGQQRMRVPGRLDAGFLPRR